MRSQAVALDGGVDHVLPWEGRSINPVGGGEQGPRRRSGPIHMREEGVSCDRQCTLPINVPVTGQGRFLGCARRHPIQGGGAPTPPGSFDASERPSALCY
jgi:hypothetical protein